MIARNYARRVLLVITGMSPQVLTETLYALSQGQAADNVPNEIHVITTAKGRRSLADMLGGNDQVLIDMASQLGLPPFVLPPEHIHVLADANGRLLDDIATPEQNISYANLVTGLLREFTSDPDSRIHVSIAGGRKTMGFLLGYAFTLFARPQDQLSHVLVSPAFENLPGFLYPTSAPKWLATRDGSTVNAQDAVINLVEIPFVGMRMGLPKALLSGDSTYERVVAAARQSLERPRLLLDVKNRRIAAGDVALKLPPLQMAIYALLARRTGEGQPPLRSPDKGMHEEWNRLIAEEVRRMEDLPMERERARRPAGLAAETQFERDVKDCKSRVYENMSRLKNLLNKALGPAAPHYLIYDGGTRPRRYSLILPPDAIEFI
jgi:CRISPR-associated protein (TIGR02584 family)